MTGRYLSHLYNQKILWAETFLVWHYSSSRESVTLLGLSTLLDTRLGLAHQRHKTNGLEINNRKASLISNRFGGTNVQKPSRELVKEISLGSEETNNYSCIKMTDLEINCTYSHIYIFMYITIAYYSIILKDSMIVPLDCACLESMLVLVLTVKTNFVIIISILFNLTKLNKLVLDKCTIYSKIVMQHYFYQAKP